MLDFVRVTFEDQVLETDSTPSGGCCSATLSLASGWDARESGATRMSVNGVHQMATSPSGIFLRSPTCCLLLLTIYGKKMNEKTLLMVAGAFRRKLDLITNL